VKAPSRREVRVFGDPEALARAAAEELAGRAEAAVQARNRFTLALSGGHTPLGLYRFLAGPYEPRFAWDHIHLFWGDERDVPADAEASNYGTLQREMLDRMSRRPAGIHPIPATGHDPDAAARAYERELVEFFHLPPGGAPRFDTVLLGLGSDGHTASLFPGTAAVGERRRLVVDNWVEKLSTHRITVTLPLLNASRATVFLVEGEAKAEVLSRVLDGPADAAPLPAQLVEPEDGDLLWLVDRAAASRLAL
jgi:6-phosphogluconolactonase